MLRSIFPLHNSLLCHVIPAEIPEWLLKRRAHGRSVRQMFFVCAAAAATSLDQRHGAREVIHDASLLLVKSQQTRSVAPCSG